MSGNRRTWAILLAVYATFALDVFSTFTSSPQTTEINASARADTLMKWVKVGAAVAVAGGVVGSAVDRSALPIVATGSIALGMYFLYVHAKNRGLESSAPGTESYGGGWGA